jgi:hypothetical protein
MAIDKDILIKGNKIYSPETCIFVSRKINSLFVKCNKSRGQSPIGVCKHGKKYYVRCSSMGIGSFKTIEEAFNAYKQYKEDYIKQVADEYKNKIPKKLYDALYKYEVEITD